MVTPETDFSQGRIVRIQRLAFRGSGHRVRRSPNAHEETKGFSPLRVEAGSGEQVVNA